MALVFYVLLRDALWKNFPAASNASFLSASTPDFLLESECKKNYDDYYFILFFLNNVSKI